MNRITKKSIGVSLKKIIPLTLLMVVIFAAYVYAAPPTDIPTNTDALDRVIKWIATWAGKIGLVIAFFGGIQTALAFKNEDAEAKVRGLKTLAAGFMVYAISKSLDLFGL